MEVKCSPWSGLASVSDVDRVAEARSRKALLFPVLLLCLYEVLLLSSFDCHGGGVVCVCVCVCVCARAYVCVCVCVNYS